MFVNTGTALHRKTKLEIHLFMPEIPYTRNAVNASGTHNQLRALQHQNGQTHMLKQGIATIERRGSVDFSKRNYRPNQCCRLVRKEYHCYLWISDG